MSLPLFDKVFSGEPKPTRRLSGKDLRDSGMASVMDHTGEAFKQRLTTRIEEFPKGYRFTMDRVVDEIGGRPSEVHPNAIGAITFRLAQRGLITRTGVMLKAERASLRRTDMPEWERS
jgi:hypothetical protein